jgi:hypothetical protein
MKNKLSMIMAILAMLFPALALPAEKSQFKQAQVSPKGDVPKDGIKPKDGFVPNSATAIEIAAIVLQPIYGADEIEKQQPFTAELRGGVWVVQGSMVRGTGTAEVNISKRTGAVLRVIHGK